MCVLIHIIPHYKLIFKKLNGELRASHLYERVGVGSDGCTEGGGVIPGNTSEFASELSHTKE